MRPLRSAVFLILLAGCGDDPVRPPRVTPISPDSIRISAANDSVWVGRTIRLSATGFGAHAGATSFAWSSTDTTRLLIDSVGLARAIRPGAVLVRVERDSAVDSFTVRAVLPEVRSPVRFTALGTGYYSWLALGTDGYAYRRTGYDSGFVVAKVEGTPVFVGLSAALRYACGRTAAGELWCWTLFGSDPAGTPKRVASPMTFGAFAVGFGAACGARADDALLHCWGSNTWYQLGRESRDVDPTAVEPTDAMVRAKLVTTSGAHTCVITPEDETYCWGLGASGQLGATVGLYTPIPQRVDVGERFRTVSAGPHFTCGATVDGNVYCWGTNRNGELGIGTVDALPHPEPSRVTGLPPVTTVATGLAGACATSIEGALYCWGITSALELARQTLAPVPTPVEIAPGYQFQDVRIYHGLVCGLTVEGRLYCW